MDYNFDFSGQNRRKEYSEYSDNELNFGEVLGDVTRKVSRHFLKKCGSKNDELGIFLIFVVVIWTVMILSFLQR